MAFITTLKKVKKDRDSKLVFSYNSSDGTIHLWNNEVVLEINEGALFTKDINCMFDDLWKIIKDCKAKDVIKILESNNEYKIKINEQIKGFIPKISISEENNSLFLNNQDSLNEFKCSSSLSSIVKKLEKHTLKIDLYDSLKYLFCQHGVLFSDNLVSIELFNPIYFMLSDSKSNVGFTGTFKINFAYLKNIELLNEKNMFISEYKDKIYFDDGEKKLVVRKLPFNGKDIEIPKLEKPQKINVEWDIDAKEAKQLLRDSITSTDKSIVCPMKIKDKIASVYGHKIGKCDLPDCVLSFKDCIEGFGKNWYYLSGYVYFNFKNDENHKMIFKIKAH